MNISTYESRIKALEDQLNPPAPSGRTGLVSVVVEPDVTMHDGTTLNAKLAAMMPLTAGDEFVEDTETTIPDGDYVFTITPGADWFAYDENTWSEMGSTLISTKTVVDNALNATFYASEDANLEGSFVSVIIGFGGIA